jgi:hypothetical protein
MVFGIFSSAKKINGYIVHVSFYNIFTLFSDDVAIRSPYLLDIPRDETLPQGGAQVMCVA